MRRPRPWPWILFILCLGSILLQCGRKSVTKAPDPESTDLSPYVPKEWDQQSDWPQNALKAKEIP